MTTKKMTMTMAKTTKTTTKTKAMCGIRAACGVAALVLLCGVPVFGAALVLTNGTRVEGRNLRLNARGDYVLETAQGIRTYAPAQVDRAEADKPAGYDEAMALRATQPDEAVQRLTRIARENRGLGWDARAWFDVASIATARGRHDEAVAAFEQLPPRTLEIGDVRAAYWSALVEAGRFGKVVPMLNEAIPSTPRPLSARATLLRGDARRGQEQLEPALLDYLRVWTLYADVREAQPEALYKAARTLSELKDPRSRELLDELERDYPNSPWAARARGGN